jgi:hypothetical protein
VKSYRRRCSAFLHALGLVAVLAASSASAVHAEDAPAAPVPADSNRKESEPTPEERSARLAKEFGDPLTTLPQVSLQEIYTPDNYGTAADANRLVLRPIIPRLPKYSLLPFVQLIRPTFSLVTVPTGPGGNTRTEFGDIQLFDFAVLPWPKPETGLYIGVGPTVNFPTATYRTAGVGAWQIGPALGIIYKGIPGLLLGCLVQNPFSVEYTTANHPSSSTLLFQPIVVAYLGHGFYVKSADSTWVEAWDKHGTKTLPVSFGVGYVWIRPGAPPINVSINSEWMAWREDTPVAPKASVRLGFIVAFPDWSPWS